MEDVGLCMYTHVRTLGTGEDCVRACWELSEGPVPPPLVGLNIQEQG